MKTKAAAPSNSPCEPTRRASEQRLRMALVIDAARWAPDLRLAGAPGYRGAVYFHAPEAPGFEWV